MRDPHVEKLHYRVSSGEGISYRDPEPIIFSDHLGAFELRDGSLSIAPAEHFADEDGARRAIEPFLRAWEIEADLTSNMGMIRFKFDRADIVDHDPPPPGSSVIRVAAASIVAIGEFAAISLTCARYPQPPKTFRATPEVEIVYRRWTSFRTGKEPLQSMAYFVLDLLQTTAGSRENAAQTFQISMGVLDTMGRLSSTKGDEMTARKAPRTGEQFQELTGPESAWLEAAVRRVIHRWGEHDSGSPLIMITLADLPTL